MRISDWSSDVCSSDLCHQQLLSCSLQPPGWQAGLGVRWCRHLSHRPPPSITDTDLWAKLGPVRAAGPAKEVSLHSVIFGRSEEHTSELQSLMRISYAVFCLNKKNIDKTRKTSIFTQQ